jgi:hypothetical protein
VEQLDTSRPHVLLVHGAWHGGWAWEMVERELTARGWRVQAVELPSTADRGGARAGLHDDAQAVRQAVEAIIGETLLTAAGGEPPPWWVIDGETITADNPRDRPYHDVPSEQADWAIAKLRPFSWVAVTEALSAAAWHTVPSTYIVCDRDAAFTEGQQYFAARANEVRQLRSGHSPLLSVPEALAALIIEAASAAAKP